MRFNRRRGNLSLMSVTKGKIYRMSQERQRVSFIIVIVFMAIFGMIVLAEVLNISLDNTRNAPDVLYDDDEDNVVVAEAGTAAATSSIGGGGVWETPKPLAHLPADNDRLVLSAEKSNSLRLSLKRHQEEMEMLIKNISASIRKKTSSTRPIIQTAETPQPPPQPEPYTFPTDFDFDLKHSRGT